MTHLRSACICVIFLTGAAAGQTLSNGSLAGTYFFRHLLLGSDATGNVTDMRSALGAVSSSPRGGAPGAGAEPFNRTLETPTIYFGDKTGTVTYSGLAPCCAGLYQINVTIPADAPIDAAVPLAIATAEHYHDQADIAISK